MISKEAFLLLQNHGFLHQTAICEREEDGHCYYRNADGSRVHVSPDGTMYYSDKENASGTIFPDGSAEYEDQEQQCSGKFFSDGSGFFIDSDGIIYQRGDNLAVKAAGIRFSVMDVFNRIMEEDPLNPSKATDPAMADVYLKQLFGDSVIHYLTEKDSFELLLLKMKMRNFLDAPEREKRKEAQRLEWEKAEKNSKALTIKVWLGIVAVGLFLSIIAGIKSLYVYQKNLIEIGYASGDLIGLNTMDVIGMLNANGFINVKAEAVEDLTLDTLELENQVIEVNCNGISSFEPDYRLHNEKEIVVRYHALQEIPVPVGSGDLGDMDYNELIAILSSAGFVNISAEGETEKVFSWMHKEGELKSITIDGKSSFKEGDTFHRDVPVIIKYYTKE